MHPTRVLAFMLSVMAALAAVCLVFPSDGIQMGSINLNFPTLGEVLNLEDGVSAEGTAVSSPAAQEEQRCETFFHYPDGGEDALDRFFAALDSASTRLVRVAHYGDSQIETDCITSTLRYRLQQRFGGMGPGLEPLMDDFYTYSISENTSLPVQSTMVYGPEDQRAGASHYGPMGISSRLDTALTVSFSPMKGCPRPSRCFNRITVLAGNIEGSLSVSCGQNTRKTEQRGTGISRLSFELPDSSTRASLRLSGHADIFGISLEGSTGVNVDNFPMRGCSGTIFTQINRNHLRDYLSGVELIILQYGGNTVPYMKTDAQASNYRTALERQIRHLQSLAPEAAILFIGPSDMATSIKGVRQTYPNLPTLVDSIRVAANNCGAVFWDMYSAMGGSGSMVSWVKSTPPLAGADYIHFTPRGAEKMGGMIFDALMAEYERRRR